MIKRLLDDLRFGGTITIRHKRGGREIRGWQEYQILHSIRKYFGINFPKIFGLTGYWKFGVTYRNLVPTAGKGLISGRINGVGSPAAPTVMAIGIGTTSPAAGDTALESEITTNGGEKGSGTATLQTTTVTNDTCRLVKSWTFTGGFAITEMGILNSVPTLLVRNTFSAYNVVSGDTFEITHNLKNA
jgi:hypothetical protein